MPISVLVLVSLASAADLHVGVGRPYGTLQAAVDAAATGDRIVVQPGSFGGFTTTKTLEVVGVEGAGAVTVAGLVDVNGGTLTLRGLTLDGDGARRALDISGGAVVTVEDSVLRDGYASTDGGCATVASADLVLRRTVVEDCVAENEGGGIYLSSADLDLEGAVIRDDRVVAGRGGGLYAVGSATQVVDQGSTWARNVAADPTSDGGNGFGGAVYLRDGADGTFLDTTFDANDVTSARADGGIGGAIRGYAADLVVQGGWLKNNLAAERGMAIASSSGGTVSLAGVRVEDNLSTDPVLTPAYGGALFCEGGTVCTVDRSWFEGNVAGDGPAIGALSSLTVTASGFCANDATEDGGAVDLGNLTSGAVRLSGNLFLNNHAVSSGGALVVSDQVLDVVHNTFAGNDAPSGGAIDWTSDGLTYLGPALTGNVVIGNTATGFAVELGPLIATEDHDWFSANTPADLDRAPGASTVVGVDPGLVIPDTCDPSGLIPDATGPLIDAGDPTLTDPDGSAADLGFTGGPDADPGAFADADGDGFLAMVDCDDTRAEVHLGAIERCGNNLDDDCDGLIDAADLDATDAAWRHQDADLDGFGDPAEAGFRCAATGWVTNGDDCDDTDAGIGLGSIWYVDGDVDGLGDPTRPVYACVRPPNAVTNADDCDDASAAIGLEQTWVLDADHDGHGVVGSQVTTCFAPTADHAVVPADDCDDGDAQVRPGAVEQCNGRDDDCDDYVDEDVVDVDWWPDADLDLFGDANVDPVRDCAAPGPDWAPVAGDCDDQDDRLHPGAPETCDGADEDCDGLVDGDDPDVDLLTGVATWPDGDGDGFGDRDATPERACEPPPGRVTDGTDCDDASASVYPGATEIDGDGVDQDCDGIDPELPPEVDVDTDGDGLTDDEEVALGTDPNDPDTDGDGVLDPADPWPLDPSGTDGAPVRPAKVDYGFGCGCDQPGPGRVAWAAPLLGLLLIRRRR